MTSDKSPTLRELTAEEVSHVSGGSVYAPTRGPLLPHNPNLPIPK